MDLYACGRYVILPNQTVAVPTGIALHIPDGHVGLIWDKSSMGLKSLKSLGGVVDAGYRGEIKVMIHNMSQHVFTFENGQKVAQMLVQKIELCEVEEVNDLEDSVRGEGAFGSTGA